MSGSSAQGPVPYMADTKPKKVLLEAGKTYYWCQCGRSANQPFCDGSHKGTPFKPKKFVAEKTEERSLCLCKHTENAPFCDGSHRKPEVLQAYTRQLLQANSTFTERINELEEEKKRYKIICLALGVVAAALALKGKL